MKVIAKGLYINIFLFAFSVQFTFAQDSCFDCNYDSLVNQLQKPHTDAERIKLLSLLIDLTGEPSQEPPERTIKFIDELIELNKQVRLIDTAPYEIMREGFILWREGEFKTALTVLQSAVESFDKKKKKIPFLLLFIRILYNRLNVQEERYNFYKQKLDYYLTNGPVENIAPCYHGIAGFYFSISDYNQAISNYLKAADIFRNFYCKYYNREIVVVGHSYALWGNDERANYYLKMALPLLKASGQNENTSSCLNSLCKLSITNGNYNEALQYAEESIKYCNKNYPNPSYAIALLQKGFVYLENKQPVLAYPFLSEAKKISDSLYPQIVQSYGDLEIDFALYRYHQIINKYTLAEKDLLKAYDKAFNEKLNRLKLKYLEELSFFYERQNPELSLRYIRQYYQLNDTIQQTQNKFKIAVYENEKKETAQNKRIYQLRQERAVQEATLSKRNMVLWISFSALVLIGVSLIFLYRQFQINKKTLLTLRKTQDQLILSEKMRSLGELTAGIAHEIQNPLNFVNNFSEINTELVIEMKDEIDKGNLNEAKDIANNVIENEQKINHHGKRADAIVKGMLQHSRMNTDQIEPTDINALADEYIRLSYHGLRAKDKSFNATSQTNFDQSIGKVNIVPQDMGRVLLNLFNNAFYAVTEKKKQQPENYQPTVTVTTKAVKPLSGNGHLEIRVKDNGPGIPQKILNKIFQPFFTTKPTGQGTGLGLSLAYDIVTKQHGGQLKVETKEGEGAEFVIMLPKKDDV